jgi:hypothetical protein
MTFRPSRLLKGSRIQKGRKSSMLKEAKVMKRRVATTVFRGIFLVMLVFTATAVFAQRPPDNQPDMTIGASSRKQALDILIKSLKEDYVFPEIGDKVTKMLEEREAHGEYNSVTSTKEFARILTRRKSFREISVI